MNFVWLVFAHFIGDIALQSDWQAQNKGRFWYVMVSHCLIWTAVVCYTLLFLDIYSFWKAIFLVIGHFVCDSWKVRKPKTPEAWKFIYPDQAFHFVQLMVVFLF